MFLCFNILCFGTVETFYTNTFFFLWHFGLSASHGDPTMSMIIFISHTWFTLSPSIFPLIFSCYTHTHIYIFRDDFRMGFSEIIALVTSIILHLIFLNVNILISYKKWDTSSNDFQSFGMRSCFLFKRMLKWASLSNLIWNNWW